VNHHILIAGGGVGGMAAALALLNRGHDVDISPNGTRALHALGVFEELQKLSCDTTGKEVRLWNSGRTWKLFDLGAEAIGRYGFPYVTVFRPDLLRLLADAVRARKPNAIHLGRRVAGVTQENGVASRSILTVARRFAAMASSAPTACIPASGTACSAARARVFSA
jgi:salicylate hydroxylase